MAAPLPWFWSWRTTTMRGSVAAAAEASSAVRSVEPSSHTTICLVKPSDSVSTAATRDRISAIVVGVGTLALGLALVVIMTLHAGFQFGWNVHTLAYLLVCVVVASGIAGVWFYLRYPEQMSRNRAAQTREQMLAELADLDRLCAKQASALGGEYPDVIVSARDRAALGGSAWSMLAGRDHSRIVLPGAPALPNPSQARLLDWLGHQLAESTDGERTRLIHELMTLVNTRRGLLDRLRRDAQIRAWLDAWLYLHIPATCALLAALAAHVLVVFLYW